MRYTFWTLIDNEYYRIHNGILKYAPNENNSIDINQEITVIDLNDDKLKLINKELGSNFILDDLKKWKIYIFKNKEKILLIGLIKDLK